MYLWCAHFVFWKAVGYVNDYKEILIYDLVVFICISPQMIQILIDLLIVWLIDWLIDWKNALGEVHTKLIIKTQQADWAATPYNSLVVRRSTLLRDSIMSQLHSSLKHYVSTTLLTQASCLNYTPHSSIMSQLHSSLKHYVSTTLLTQALCLNYTPHSNIMSQSVICDITNIYFDTLLYVKKPWIVSHKSQTFRGYPQSTKHYPHRVISIEHLWKDTRVISTDFYTE